MYIATLVVSMDDELFPDTVVVLVVGVTVLTIVVVVVGMTTGPVARPIVGSLLWIIPT